MLNQLKNTLSNALCDVIHKPSKTNLSEIDFSLSVGKNLITIRGSHKFIVHVDDENAAGHYKSQTLTALIYDCDAQEISLPQLKITQDGRLTKVWLVVSEKQNHLSEFKKELKPTFTQEEKSHAVEGFEKAYVRVSGYIESPQLDTLKDNLDGLILLNRTIAKLNKMRIFKHGDLDLNAIQEKCYCEKAEAAGLLALHEEIKLSQKRHLKDFGYIQKKKYPEKGLGQFGTFSSSARRVNGVLENQLALPLYADLGGRLVGYQTISSTGGKYYHLLKGVKSTGVFAVLGALDELQTGQITLCEGFATGLSLKMINPESKVLVCLDANGLKACTRKFADREMIHALDNDTRIFSEKHKKNSGIEFSLQIESELKKENPEKTLQISRLAVAAPSGFSGFKIDFDDLRMWFNNDFDAVKKHLSESKFIFNQITDLNDKSNYFVHSRYLSHDFLPDFSQDLALTLSTNAPTGGGKTSLLKSITSQTKSTIYVCPRVSLTSQAADDLNLYIYKDLIGLSESYKPDPEKGLRVASTFHSLWRILEENTEAAREIDCLILDEVDQIFSGLKDLSDDNTEKRLNALVGVLKRAKKVVLLSATLNKDLLAEIRGLRPLATNLHIYNTCVQNRGTVKLYNDEKTGGIYDKLMRKSAAGRDKIAYSCDRADNLIQIFNDLKDNFPHRKVLLCTGKDFLLSFDDQIKKSSLMNAFFANPDEFIQQNQIDTLLYSPILQTGFSIDTEFDVQYFDYSLFSINPKSQLQQTMRIRNARERVGRTLDASKQVDDIKKMQWEFTKSRRENFALLANRIRGRKWDTDEDNEKARGIARELEFLSERFSLNSEENLIFSMIYDDEVQYRGYRNSFVKLLELNGLTCDFECQIQEESSGFTAKMSDLDFVSRAEKFYDEENNDILKTTLEKTLSEPIGLRKAHTLQQLKRAEMPLPNVDTLEGMATLERLTIYKNPKKYITEAKNFLLLNDPEFEKEFERVEVIEKENKRTITSLLSKIDIAKEIAAAGFDDEKLLEKIQDLRQKSRKVRGKVIKVDQLKTIFGIKPNKHGEKITVEQGHKIADKILGICGLSLSIMRGQDMPFLEFWENFANELKAFFVTELKTKSNLKKETLNSLSDKENISNKSAYFFNNETTFANAELTTPVGDWPVQLLYQKVDKFDPPHNARF